MPPDGFHCRTTQISSSPIPHDMSIFPDVPSHVASMSSVCLTNYSTYSCEYTRHFASQSVGGEKVSPSTPDDTGFVLYVETEESWQLKKTVELTRTATAGQPRKTLCRQPSDISTKSIPRFRMTIVSKIRQPSDHVTGLPLPRWDIVKKCRAHEDHTFAQLH